MNINTSAFLATEIPPLNFPCLLINKDNGLIIIATSYEDIDHSQVHGTCITPGTTDNEVGGYSSMWNLLVFTEFYGSVVISSEKEE